MQSNAFITAALIREHGEHLRRQAERARFATTARQAHAHSRARRLFRLPARSSGID